MCVCEFTSVFFSIDTNWWLLWLWLCVLFPIWCYSLRADDNNDNDFITRTLYVRSYGMAIPWQCNTYIGKAFCVNFDGNCQCQWLFNPQPHQLNSVLLYSLLFGLGELWRRIRWLRPISNYSFTILVFMRANVFVDAKRTRERKKREKIVKIKINIKIKWNGCTSGTYKNRFPFCEWIFFEYWFEKLQFYGTKRWI